ncbi:hypothetical protein GIB67_001558 [Kingdonia uniflora]|uniref:Uncharacterized protein n=1 Tax=Kingdonia uniflora TaxID=39325 RepID=A0A7J7L709_9MAGN|nr:hypothetical protein GIB67_001558 [Kingdonia uniflora]
MNQSGRLKGLICLISCCAFSWLSQLKTLTNEDRWTEESVNSISIKHLLILRLMLG